MISNTKLILYGVIVTLTAILYHGYALGSGDQVEIMPVFNLWNGVSSYINDFYIQSFLSKSLTERSPFLHLVYFLTHGHPWLIFLLHLLTALLLFCGLIRVAEWVSGSAMVGVLAVLVTLTIGSRFSLGGNELYYHLLIPSVLSKALGIWSLFFWYNMKTIRSVALLICATYIQPLVGLQLFVLMTIGSLWMRRDLGNTILQVLIYSLFIAPWILTLFMQQAQGEMPTELYRDIIEFRVAHHFFPQYFHTTHYIVTFLLMLVALVWFRIKSRETYIMILSIVSGCLIYFLFVIGLNSQLLLNTQWFKTTIWLEFFSFIAVIDVFRSRFNLDMAQRNISVPILVVIPLASALLFYSGIKKPEMMLPWRDQLNEEVALSIWARDHVPSDAVFVVPTSYTAFKYYSGHSCYVDYKAMIHHHDIMQRWYERVKEIYDVHIGDRRSGDLASSLMSWPVQLSASYIDKLQGLGVTHLILPQPEKGLKDLPLKEIYKSASDQVILEIEDRR